MQAVDSSQTIVNRSPILWAVATLLTGLCLSVTASVWQSGRLAADEAMQLERRAERGFDALEEALWQGGMLLRAVQAVYMASDDPTMEQFVAIYDTLDVRSTFPSLQALGFAHRSVDAAGMERFITDRVAPLRGNERLMGLDIATQPSNMLAVFASRDSNQPAMSAAFQLIQRAGMPGFQDGVTLRLPVYRGGSIPRSIAERREQFSGSLVASFHVSGLIETALPRDMRETLHIRVTDVTGGAGSVLFESTPADWLPVALNEQGIEFRHELVFGGRVWQLQATALPRPAEWPFMTLLGGMLASLFAAGMVWALLATRSRALALAEVLSAQYRISEGKLRLISERLAYQANHDELTGLGNRRAFQAALDTAISEVNAGGGSRALLYLDLDQFKLVNDTSGHIAGDELLVQLARTLQAAVDEGDIVTRLGGDEFGILLASCDEAQALESAEMLRHAVDDFVFHWNGTNYSLTASLGMTLLNRKGLASRELLAMADTACYFAKERGRNRLHVFREGDEDIAARRAEMAWISRIQKAMSEGRLSLDVQELQCLGADKASDGAHFEILLRMQDEHGNAVMPGQFIPAAERFGLMPQLDRWVVQTAFANFEALHPRGDEVDLCAINLSGATVDDERFAAFVLDELERHGVPPHRVCFEITETAAVGNMDAVLRFVDQLKAVGCRFALDDFGSGMSSFGYLKDLPFDLIKIDGSFIKNIESDEMSQSIVRAVTDIGHQVGLQVIAEWVDSEAACDLLSEIGVDFAQGYFVHVPEPARYCY